VESYVFVAVLIVVALAIGKIARRRVLGPGQIYGTVVGWIGSTMILANPRSSVLWQNLSAVIAVAMAAVLIVTFMRWLDTRRDQRKV
jgi:uncharacterized protein YacL